jgi:hypothetical protein
MIFANILFVSLFMVTIKPSSEAMANCPGIGPLCGTTCTIEAKTKEREGKCYCSGPCDGGDPVKDDYNGGWFL